MPEGTKYVTCAYCASRLAVQQSGNAVYTQVLETLEKKTEQIAQDVGVLKLQGELEDLDRHWAAERESLMITKQGQREVPTASGNVVGFGIMIGFGVLWTIMAVAITSGSPFPVVGVIFPLFGVLFIGAGIAGFIYAQQKARQYERAERDYQARRRQLQREIESQSGR